MSLLSVRLVMGYKEPELSVRVCVCACVCVGGVIV